MPHIILEVPHQFDTELAKKVINLAQQFLVEKLPTKLETFKSRVYRYSFSSVAGDDRLDVIHVQIKVLKGRKLEHLEEISQQLKAKICELLNPEVNLDSYSITLELMELSIAYAN
ncbi:tautomerase family protein [Francisella sciaenopsi]|uniref:5-carboxymethyl-2-hydroxymuconate isomerase n=1 Tax=Francisella sciaenopsi TaxID=3055034 RepID=A0ABQ6PHD7_9GAMM